MSDRVLNGWFVNEDRAVYAVINGSLYEVEPDGPIAELSPGSYDDDLNAVKEHVFRLKWEQPRALYVRRDVVNHQEIRDWYGKQGLVVDGALHVTVAFSRRPLLWSAVQPSDHDLQARALPRIEQLGDEGAVVQFVASPQLEREWQAFIDAGASWDYDGYRPHVTLTYDGAPDDLEPFAGIIRLGPQIYDEIEETKGYPEFDPNQPRDESGRWGSGGGDAGDGSSSGDIDVESHYGPSSKPIKYLEAQLSRIYDMRWKRGELTSRKQNALQAMFRVVSNDIAAHQRLNDEDVSDEDAKDISTYAWRYAYDANNDITAAIQYQYKGDEGEILWLGSLTPGAGVRLAKEAIAHLSSHEGLDTITLSAKWGSEKFWAKLGFEVDGREDSETGMIPMSLALDNNQIEYKPGLLADKNKEKINATKDRWFNQSPVKGKSIQEAMAIAAAAQKELVAAANEIAKAQGVKFINPGHKSDAKRVQAKADKRGGIERVTDLARGGFVVTEPGQVEPLVKAIADKFETVAEDWKRTDVDYIDKALLIHFKNGVVGEVQIWEEKMYHAKFFLGGHDAYAERVRLDPEKDQERIDALEAKQKALYGPIIEGYSPAWKAALGKAGR